MTDQNSKSYSSSGNSESKGRGAPKKLPMHLRKAVSHQNRARAACGLPQLTVQVRQCLVCKKKFESVGNRLCGCVPRKVAFLGGSEVIL